MIEARRALVGAWALGLAIGAAATWLLGVPGPAAIVLALLAFVLVAFLLVGRSPVG